MEYTFILDISIKYLPRKNEQLTLITLNSQTDIYLIDDGPLCLSLGRQLKMKSKSTWKCNQYVRLLISVRQQCLIIYTDGSLELEASADREEFMIKDNYIKLFCEENMTNDDDDRIRLECRSITYMNWFMMNIDERMKSIEYSLESFVVPPYSIIAPSLIYIGHDESLIKLIMKDNLIRNSQTIDRIIREQYEKRQNDLIGKLNPSIDRDKMKDLLSISEFDTDEKIVVFGETLFDHWNDIQTCESFDDPGR